MKSDTIFDIIEFIAEESSKNKKIILLKDFLENDIFLQVIRLAYDPFITFGVKNLNESFKPGKENFNNSTFELLKKLRKREISGNFARDQILDELSRLNEKSGILLLRILDKNLRAGFDVKSLNKARLKTIPEFPYMRCSLPSEVKLETWDWSRGIIVQEKADGLFCNITKFNDLVTMQTRTGQLFPEEPFEALLEEYRENFPKHTQAHGEVRVLRDGVVLPRKDGNGVINHVMKGGSFASNEEPILDLWDLITINDIENKISLWHYSERLKYLMHWLDNCKKIHLIETKLVFSFKQAMTFYIKARKLGKEGAIVKKKSLIWKSHTSKDQVKLKNESICELRIIDFIPGTGKNSDTFGSLLCVSECGELSAAVAGLTDEKRLEIYSNKDKWLNSIISVKFNEIINDKKDGWSLFSPRFEEERFDRSEADTLKRIQQIVKEF